MNPPKEPSRGERRGSHLREIHEEERQVLGEEFRLARLQRGEDLPAIAAKLRIRTDHLQAIEDGRFDDLPGTTYAIGFLRSYARHLGLDPDAVLTRYRQESRAELAGSTLYFPEPIKEARRPRSWMVALALLLLAGIYAAWYYGSTERRMAQEVSPLPERLASSDATSSTATPHPAPVAPSAAPSEPLHNTPSPEAGTAPGAAAPFGSAPAPADSVTGAPVASNTGVPAPQAAAPATPNPESETAPPTTLRGQGTPGYPENRGDTAIASTGARDWRAGPAVPPAASTGANPGENGQPSPQNPAEAPWNERPAAGQANSSRGPDFGNLIATTQKPDVTAGGSPQTPPASGTAAVPAHDGGAVQQNIAALHPVTTLHASGATWVQLEGQGGDVLLSRILQPGESYRLPDETGLMLTTGNAGGLDIEVNGTHTGPMGPVGAVRRHISIDQLRADAR